MYDIVFIGSKGNQFNKLKEKFPTAKLAADFNAAKLMCFTKFFWVVWDDLDIDDSFDFSYKPDEYSKDYVHIFKNNKEFDGVCLFPKRIEISNRELNYRFFTNKKEVDIVASTPIPYDIVFISYNESNADNNYAKLIKRFPRAKRVHGVKGIHQAHVEAAKLCDSDMFWVVDADAEVVDDFKFDYYIPAFDSYSKKTVHVWKSKNPINNLEYGNGGIKLLPRTLTINVDVNSTDMTTSISTQFKSMDSVSNINRFDTDPFNVWKSAFRECCKLASKTIRGQVDNETEQRLKVWCEEGLHTTYGRYAVSGACSGRDFGYDNRNSPDKLNLINDFDWLYEQFQRHTVE